MAHGTNTRTLQQHEETSASYIPARKQIYPPKLFQYRMSHQVTPHIAAQYQAVPKKITPIRQNPTHSRSILRHYQLGQNTYYQIFNMSMPMKRISVSSCKERKTYTL
eukprot:14849375-Ditylum_brightwellii.AAC.1